MKQLDSLLSELVKHNSGDCKVVLIDWLNDNDAFEFAPFSLDRLVDSLTRGWFFRLEEQLSPFIF